MEIVLQIRQQISYLIYFKRFVLISFLNGILYDSKMSSIILLSVKNKAIKLLTDIFILYYYCYIFLFGTENWYI
jgi:hypothetical protein